MNLFSLDFSFHEFFSRHSPLLEFFGVFPTPLPITFLMIPPLYEYSTLYNNVILYMI